MTQRPEQTDVYDPFGVWRNMRDSGLDAWSKFMIDLVNSEAYARATASMLDTYLATSAPFRKIVETSMTQVLQQLNMPTRADVTSIAERLTNLEMRLDDLEAKLDEVLHAKAEKGSTVKKA